MCGTSSAIEILGLGAVAIDELLYVESFPKPDQKTRVIKRTRSWGGLTATALVAASRLGVKCGYAGPLADDSLSHMAKERFQSEGVDLSYSFASKVASPIHSTIIIDVARGWRNVFYFTGQNEPLPADWPPAAAFDSVKAIMVDNFNMEAQIRAARMARQRGVPVVADFESRDSEYFLELCGLVDHLILSRDFASALTGREDNVHIIAALRELSPQAVVITCGKDGCWYTHALPSANGRPSWSPIRHCPAFKVDTVDSTGCGDVFHGAYAAAIAHHIPIDRAILLASAAAAIKATRPGGPDGAPTKRDVATFLENSRC
jgi:sulfofructose kinase